MAGLDIDIREVVSLLGLRIKPGDGINNRSFNVVCPVCGEQTSGRRAEYKLNVSVDNQVWRCPKCGEGGGVIALYSYAVYGVTGKAVYKELKEALGKNTAVRKFKDVPTEPSVMAADDVTLDTAYRALLSILTLSPMHKDNLLKRGLTEEAIEKGGYKSFPSFARFSEGKYAEAYDKLGLEKGFEKLPKVAVFPREKKIACFALGNRVAKKGIDLNAVPGFFKVYHDGTYQWCFMANEGFLIPTRNEKGQIVGLQTRTNRGDVRYITVSSKELPAGPDKGITRIHHPLTNTPLNEKSSVYITEGPLKSDVAACLMRRQGKNPYFIALQGVRNTNGLEDEVKAIKEAGIEVIYNAFDMDKITNVDVYNAGESIKELIEKNGLKFKYILWDEEGAKEKLKEIYPKYTQLGGQEEALVSKKTVFGKLDAIYAFLDRDKSYRKRNTTKGERAWNSDKKGIDDYLLWKYEK